MCLPGELHITKTYIWIAWMTKHIKWILFKSHEEYQSWIFPFSTSGYLITKAFSEVSHDNLTLQKTLVLAPWNWWLQHRWCRWKNWGWDMRPFPCLASLVVPGVTWVNTQALGNLGTGQELTEWKQTTLTGSELGAACEVPSAGGGLGIGSNRSPGVLCVCKKCLV
jgi:hypothetical protein